MSTIEQSREESIVRSIYELCCLEGNAKGSRLSFGPDWGGNSLTVYYGENHFHVGDPEGDEHQLTHELAMSLRSLVCEREKAIKEVQNAH